MGFRICLGFFHWDFIGNFFVFWRGRISSEKCTEFFVINLCTSSISADGEVHVNTGDNNKGEPKGEGEDNKGEADDEEEEEEQEIVKMPKPMKASKVAEIRMKAISDKYMGTLLRELAFFVFYIAMLFLVSAGKDVFLEWRGVT